MPTTPSQVKGTKIVNYPIVRIIDCAANAFIDIKLASKVKISKHQKFQIPMIPDEKLISIKGRKLLIVS